MSNIYRGYIIKYSESDYLQDVAGSQVMLTVPSWIVKFPDFPEIRILSSDNRILTNTNLIEEECFTKIVNQIIHIIEEGREAPIPQTHLQYPFFVDVGIDVDAIQDDFRLKIAN